jgi:hypothetical protein
MKRPVFSGMFQVRSKSDNNNENFVRHTKNCARACVLHKPKYSNIFGRTIHFI